MHYRKFKDVSVAEVGLGTWQLRSADWGVVDEEVAFGILQAYVDQGGNFIDTADVYGMGISEKIIGKFLQKTGKELFVATKLGRRHDEGNEWPQNFGYDAMKKQVQDSLEHLGQRQLFLEQLHCIPTTELQSGKVFDHLRRLQPIDAGWIHLALRSPLMSCARAAGELGWRPGRDAVTTLREMIAGIAERADAPTPPLAGDPDRAGRPGGLAHGRLPGTGDPY